MSNANILDVPDYLVKDYGYFSNEWRGTKLIDLKSIEDFKSYFSEDYDGHFDCGQGYYQDEVVFAKDLKDGFWEILH